MTRETAIFGSDRLNLTIHPFSRRTKSEKTLHYIIAIPGYYATPWGDTLTSIAFEIFAQKVQIQNWYAITIA